MVVLSRFYGLRSGESRSCSSNRSYSVKDCHSVPSAYEEPSSPLVFSKAGPAEAKAGPAEAKVKTISSELTFENVSKLKGISNPLLSCRSRSRLCRYGLRNGETRSCYESRSCSRSEHKVQLAFIVLIEDVENFNEDFPALE